MLVALFAGVLFGAFLMARKGALLARKTAVPFGPFLALGSLVAIFAGEPLINCYTSNFLN